ncbi:MAG: histidine phosphatase family protein [Clostridiaceae bacterium]
MKTRVFLIRHGETEYNVQGRFQGSKDINLTENGIAQAHQLKERFQNKFDYIFSSPLTRAYETAKILASVNGTEAIKVDNLREINFGEWEGLTAKEVKDTYPDALELWKNDEIEGPLVGGDVTMKLAAIRGKECIMDIVKEHPGSKIAIVAHGAIIRCAISEIFNWNVGSMYHQLVLGNTAVSELTFDEKLRPQLVTLNDTNHLTEDSKSVPSL